MLTISLKFTRRFKSNINITDINNKDEIRLTDGTQTIIFAFLCREQGNLKSFWKYESYVW